MGRGRLGQNFPSVRFEVKDVSGERFIPNAQISVVFEDGTHILTRLTDAGGNAALTSSDLLEAFRSVGISNPASGVSWYTVSAPGYAMVDGILLEPGKSYSEQTGKIYEIALRPVGVNPYVVGGVATAALVMLGILT